MPTPEALLARLDAIGHSLAESSHALALLALGSAGVETERLDAYSDLDFFALVQNGYKTQYIENLDWLERVCSIPYRFRNTRDGYKILFEDGIFGEFAVFELPELEAIPFAAGRVVWKRPDVADALLAPSVPTLSRGAPPQEWLIGEALTNLYVGMNRFRRGEKLSAARFVQQYAVDRVLELARFIETPIRAEQDEFVLERGFETRFPQTAQQLESFVQGYEHSAESALAILKFLETHFEIQPVMAQNIRVLCASEPE